MDTTTPNDAQQQQQPWLTATEIYTRILLQQNQQDQQQEALAKFSHRNPICTCTVKPLQ